MARTSTKVAVLSAPYRPYSDVPKGWDGVNVTITDLPDGKKLVEVEGAALDQIGGDGSEVILNLPGGTPLPATNQVGARAAVRTNGQVVKVGPLDLGGPTISFKVTYTV